jgi:hypothetical protein
MVAFDIDKHDRIGEGLVRARLLTHDQVEEVLKIQRSGDERLFGEIAIDLAFMNDSSLTSYISSKRKVGILV